jgi:hypothetical protein
MTYHCLIAAILLAASGGSAASCVVEPLETQLRAADIVYVGTVVDSALAIPAAGLKDGARLEIKHTVLPQRVLKGEPSAVPVVVSGAVYSDPASGHFWELAEAVQVFPGDTVLVAGNAHEPTRLGLCTASRRWDTKAADSVRAVFGHAP